MGTVKEMWSLYTLVASMVSIVAKLATASAVANGTLRDSEGLSQILLAEVLPQLDSMLVLGTHFAVLAAEIEATSSVVQRMRRRFGENFDAVVGLEALREDVAQLRLRMQRLLAEEEAAGPDTQRHDQVAAGTE